MFFEPVLVVLFVVAIGFAAAKFVRFDLEGLSNLLLYILVPCLLFSSIYSQPPVLQDFAVIFAAATLVMLATGLLTMLYLRLSRCSQRGLLLAGIFGNNGYLAFPIALLAFGPSGLGYAVIYSITSSLFIYSFGISLVAGWGKGEWKEVCCMPLLYALLLGIAFSIFQLRLPEIIFQPLKMLGDASIPIGLLVLGAKLATLKMKFVKDSFAVSAIKVFGGLLAGLAVVKLFGLGGVLAGVLILQASMPSAVNSYVICEKYGCSAEAAASAVFISTLMGFFSIAAVLAFA